MPFLEIQNCSIVLAVRRAELLLQIRLLLESFQRRKVTELFSFICFLFNSFINLTWLENPNLYIIGLNLGWLEFPMVTIETKQKTANPNTAPPQKKTCWPTTPLTRPMTSVSVMAESMKIGAPFIPTNSWGLTGHSHVTSGNGWEGWRAAGGGGAGWSHRKRSSNLNYRIK